MTTILLIDHAQIQRIGLRIILENQFHDVLIFESASLDSFRLENKEAVQPDLIMLSLRQVAHYRADPMVRKIRAHYPNASLIVHDAYPILSIAVSYLNKGVKGYLGLSRNPQEILVCVKAVLGGGIFLNSECQHVPFKTKQSHRKNGGHPISLTAREFEIAEYLALGKKTSWIAQTIERKLSTVCTIKRSILNKLSLQNPSELVGALEQVRFTQKKLPVTSQ